MLLHFAHSSLALQLPQYTVNIITSVVRYFVISSLLLTAGVSIDRLLSIKQPNFYTFWVTLNTLYMYVFVFGSCLHCTISLSTLSMDALFDIRVYSSFMCIYFSCLFVYVGSSRSIAVCAREHIRRENAAQRRFGPKRDQMTLDTFRLSIINTTARDFCFYCTFRPNCSPFLRSSIPTVR